MDASVVIDCVICWRHWYRIGVSSQALNRTKIRTRTSLLDHNRENREKKAPIPLVVSFSETATAEMSAMQKLQDIREYVRKFN